MAKIETLTSLEGRKFLNDIFNKLRFEKQVSGFSALIILWKLCVYEKDPSKFVNNDSTILHSLGFLKGTSLWLEEVVNRHFFSTINSFVYFGAAIILVLIGVRRFSDAVSEELVIAGIIFEALMLMLIFLVMLFSPKEEIQLEEEKEEDLLISEIGEIGTEFATAVTKLEKVEMTLHKLVETQKEIMTGINQSVSELKKLSSPSDDFIDNVKFTNESIKELTNNIIKLTESAKTIRNAEIKFEIKKEIEKMIIDKYSNNEDR